MKKQTTKTSLAAFAAVALVGCADSHDDTPPDAPMMDAGMPDAPPVEPQLIVGGVDYVQACKGQHNVVKVGAEGAVALQFAAAQYPTPLSAPSDTPKLSAPEGIGRMGFEEANIIVKNVIGNTVLGVDVLSSTPVLASPTLYHIDPQTMPRPFTLVAAVPPHVNCPLILSSDVLVVANDQQPSTGGGTSTLQTFQLAAKIHMGCKKPNGQSDGEGTLGFCVNFRAPSSP